MARAHLRRMACCMQRVVGVHRSSCGDIGHLNVGQGTVNDPVAVYRSRRAIQGVVPCTVWLVGTVLLKMLQGEHSAQDADSFGGRAAQIMFGCRCCHGVLKVGVARL